MDVYYISNRQNICLLRLFCTLIDSGEFETDICSFDDSFMYNIFFCYNIIITFFLNLSKTNSCRSNIIQSLYNQ